METGQDRRHFLASLSAAGAAGVVASRGSLADEGPPETTTIRLAYYPNNCLAPLLVAEDLLRAEGVHRYPLRVGAGVLHRPATGRARRRPFRQHFRGNPRLSHG